MPSSSNVKMSILFVSHAGQIERFALIAQELTRRFDVCTILWTLGGKDYRVGLDSRGFDEVVNLLDGFDRFADISDSAYSELLAWLREFERRCGCHFYHQDAALDRSLSCFTDAEMDYQIIRSRWSRQQIAAMSVHLVKRAQAQIDRSNVVLAVGETNTLPYRLIYRLLRSRNIPYLYPVGLPHADGRMYFEDSLDFAWARCRTLYSEFLEKGIPQEFASLARTKLAEIQEQGMRPAYYYQVDRRPRRWTERLRFARVAQAVHEWWEVVNSRSEQTNPRTLPPELISPRARFARAIKVHFRYTAYERIAQRIIPKQSYACYFLHVQPEHTVEGLAFEYQDQVALVRNIVASLPADMVLLVKEHRGVAGRRPISFYAELTSIPNVILLHDTVDSFELIKHARVVFTLTGTVALESIVFGVPCVIFGSIYYEHFRGVYRVHNLSHLHDILYEFDKLRGASREEALTALAARYAASHCAEYPGREDDKVNARRLADALSQECWLRGNRLPSLQLG